MFERPPKIISNNLLNNRVLLVNPKQQFIDFLRNIYNDLEIDDYTISIRSGSPEINIDGFKNNLGNIFQTDHFDFVKSPFHKADDDFFHQLDEITKSYELFTKSMAGFKLNQPVKKPEPKATTIENIQGQKPVNNEYLPSSRLDNNFLNNMGTRKNISLDIRDEIPIINKHVLDNYLETKSSENIENIKAYNDFDPSYNEGDIQPFCQDNDISQECSPFSVYSWRATQEVGDDKHYFKSSILYCHSLCIAFVISKDDTEFVSYLTQHFRDFELVKTYNKLTQKELDDCILYFHKRDFETKELLEGKIDSFETLFDIEKDKKPDASKEIELFIRDIYTIDTEPKNIIKASSIVERVQLELRPNNKDKLKLSKEISSILLGMGLKKKRMADGIYYYGLTVKPLFGSNGEKTEDRFKKVVEEHKLTPVRDNISNLSKKVDSTNEGCYLQLNSLED
jgi:hypothetical protein